MGQYIPRVPDILACMIILALLCFMITDSYWTLCPRLISKHLLPFQKTDSWILSLEITNEINLQVSVTNGLQTKWNNIF